MRKSIAKSFVLATALAFAMPLTHSMAAEVHAAESAKAAYAATLGNIGITAPWSRAMPPTAHTGAVFVSIHNQGEQDALVSAHADVADTVELHTHVHVDGLMKMQKVEQMEVPAEGVLELVPGSYHIMLIGLRQPLQEGLRFPLQLEFARSGSVELEVEVLSMDAGIGASHDEHAHH